MRNEIALLECTVSSSTVVDFELVRPSDRRACRQLRSRCETVVVCIAPGPRTCSRPTAIWRLSSLDARLPLATIICASCCRQYRGCGELRNGGRVLLSVCVNSSLLGRVLPFHFLGCWSYWMSSTTGAHSVAISTSIEEADGWFLCVCCTRPAACPPLLLTLDRETGSMARVLFRQEALERIENAKGASDSRISTFGLFLQSFRTAIIGRR